MVCLSSLLEKSLIGWHCFSEPLLSFPHTPTLWQVQSLSGSCPVPAYLFFQLQVLPGSPKFSDSVRTGDCYPSLGTPLAMCVLTAISLQWFYVFRSLLELVFDFSALGGKGAPRLLLLTWLSSDVPVATVVFGTRPGDLPRRTIKPFYHLFWSILCDFNFQTSYWLRFCWLFTLYFRRSARCPSWVHEQEGSAPTYLATIFYSQSLYVHQYLLMCLCASVLGLQMFTRVMSSCFKDPFIIMKCPYWSFAIALVFKAIFVSYNYWYPSCFLFLLAWNIFTHPFTSRLCVSLNLLWVSCRQHMHESGFLPHSATLCLLPGTFNPFMLKVIIDRCVVSAILLIIFLWSS